MEDMTGLPSASSSSSSSSSSSQVGGDRWCDGNIRCTTAATASASASSARTRTATCGSCRSPMLMRTLTLMACFSQLLFRSEAFATAANSRPFLGGAASSTLRGGASHQQQPQLPSATAKSQTNNINKNNKSAAALDGRTCVLQVSRGVTANLAAAFEESYEDDSSSSSFQVTQQQLAPPQTNGFKKKGKTTNNSNSKSIESNGLPSSIQEKTAPAPSAMAIEVEFVAETKLPTKQGQFLIRGYRIPEHCQTTRPQQPYDSSYPSALKLQQTMRNSLEPCLIYASDKPPFGGKSVPVRIHDQCLTSEVLGSERCDCREQLQMAMDFVQKNGGCVIYLQQEGRGIGLANKIAAYALQDVGLDTVDANLHLGFPADARDYSVVPGILEDMGIKSIRLMSNNPRKAAMLEHLGVKVDGKIPMVVDATTPYNHKYLETKTNRMNHANLRSLIELKPPNGSINGNAMYSSIQKNGMPAMPVASRPSRNGARAPPEKTNGDNAVSGADTEDRSVAFVVNDSNGKTLSVSLLDDTVTQPTTKEQMNGEEEAAENELEGVKAAENGYCFGKQSVVDAIAAVGRGEMVVVVDDMDRENEGDFIMAADLCTPMAMAKIIRYSSGVICVGMEGKRMDELKLPPMVTKNEDPKGTAFSVSVDASKKYGITTGISATDRAKTARMLGDSRTVAADLHRPGHMFPLRARDGGVLTRDGHTEASVDLARLAGCSPCGVLCEIVSEEHPTEMMRLPEMRRFCKRHGYVMTSIVDIAQYRRDTGL